VQPDFREQARANDVPVARLIGFQAKDIRDERATVTLSAGRQHANPMGTLHGGILCDIADAAMGMALASTLEPEESFTMVELKINFFRPSLGRCAPPHRKRAHGWALLGTRRGGGRPRRRVKS
jgi:acyl-coenzyme A thioesterase PaaI-like protein